MNFFTTKDREDTKKIHWLGRRWLAPRQPGREMFPRASFWFRVWKWKSLPPSLRELPVQRQESAG
jgi:hypothetical protein